MVVETVEDGMEDVVRLISLLEVGQVMLVY